MSIISEIKNDKHKVFRRLYMRRRLSGGEYEADWVEIPREKIITYGSVQYSVDDVKPDFYKTNSLKFTVSNADGYFSDVSDDKSFFYTAISRHRTLVKLEAGYEADDGTEYPTDPSLFIGVLSEDMPYKQDGKVAFGAKHLSEIFKAFPAEQLTGLYTALAGGTNTSKTLTAKQVIEVVRDHEDSNSIAIFQKYISSGAWNITSSAKTYNLDTSTNIQGMDVWEMMQKLAGAEQQVLYIDGSGEFNFVERTAIASSITYHFSGAGDTDKTWGHNIISVDVDENIRKVFNRIRIQYQQDDTTTSYKIRNESWDYGDSSSSFIHGVRTYEYKNIFMVSTTASTVADDIYTEFKWPKYNYMISAKFVPQVSLQDRVSITYKLRRYTGDALWDWFNWGEAVWGERYGYNILLNDANARVVEVEHNIDSFRSSIVAREI